MASTAGQISRDPFCFDFRRLVAACVPASGSGDPTQRALATAGLAALLALPFLLLSSIALAAPLAVPAAIGIGFLAVSQALGARHPRRAAVLNAIVLCSLVGWLVLFLLIGEKALSHAGLTAAMMAPLVAAGPAFARSLIGTPISTPIRVHAELEGTASAFTPGLGVRAEGAATRNADIAPPLEPSCAAMKTFAARPTDEPNVPLRFAGRCDIGDAAAFALRHAAPRAEAKGVRLTATTGTDILAACDRQIGRRIFHHLLAGVLNGSKAGDTVRVDVRRLKSVALLRVASEPGDDSGNPHIEPDERLDVGTLRTLVEGAGGTLVVHRRGDDIVLSVRLDLASPKETGACK